jgi:hypothetical protein
MLLPMAFGAKAHRAEGKLRRLKSVLNKPEPLKFRFCTRNMISLLTVCHSTFTFKAILNIFKLKGVDMRSLDSYDK